MRRGSLVAVYVLVFCVSIALFLPHAAQAAPANPFQRGCLDYDSGRAFVMKANMFCLKKSSRTCEREAAKYFTACNFPGNYETLSWQLHRELLIVYVMSQLPPRQMRRSSPVEASEVSWR